MTGPTPAQLSAAAASAQQLADLLTKLAATAAGSPAPPAPAPAPVTITAVPSGTAVQVSWQTARTDVAAWTVTRDGVDTSGTGAWSTMALAATRSQQFGSLVPGATYTFTLVGHLALGGDLPPVTVRATIAGPASTPVAAPPASTTPAALDGVQAATQLSWGPVVAGDEFDYTGAPDPARWSTYDGPGHNGNGIRTPKAYSVAGGLLSCLGDAAGNSGGMAWTKGSKYQRVEVRQRLYKVTPNTEGEQYHPVLLLWPDSNQWPSGGEYDFAETDIGSSSMGAFMHHPTTSQVVQDPYSKTLDITAWHNYAFEWSPSGLTGWIDGAQFFHDTDPAAQAPGPMHLCIQLDNFGGSPHQPAHQDVAWVRFYAAPK